MQQVSKNVYVDISLTGGSNLGAITSSEGVVMVDTPMSPSLARKWQAGFSSKGPLRYLINTEYHSDHIAGNFFFDTTVVAHENTRASFLASLGSIEQLKERVKAGDPEGATVMENYQPRLPSITFSERLTLQVGDLTIKLLHLPGHTVAETAVYIPEEKVVFTGDNVVHRLHPQLFDGVTFQWLDSLRTIESLDVEVVVPGHGEVCDRSAVRSMIAQIEEIIETVRKAMNSGMSREEVAEKISFADRHPIDEIRAAWLPTYLRAGVAHVYDELAKQR